LLDVSRITQDRIELRLERLDLNAVLVQAAETSEPTLQADRHGLSLTCPPEPLWLDADPVRLAQIFGNLLNNAVKYGQAGGRILVNASRETRMQAAGEGLGLGLGLGEGEGEEEWARVSVKDNGIGISPDKLGQIFEMFSQVDPSLERARGGLGIGLMLVQKLVELHGGSVAAYSRGLGQGSELVVWLPLARDRALATPVPELPAAPALIKAPGCRALVIDDNVDAAQTLAELLDVLGVESRMAFGGLQGLHEAEAFRPDLVLLDIGMPGMNGYEVARRLRAQPWGQAIRLVALTGWGQSEDRARSREAGFDHHLVKPLDIDALMQVLGEFSISLPPTAQALEKR
jgi:CheY-like chemotaxis protein